MATLEEQHRARLANGRRLVRIARGILFVTGVPLLGGAVAFIAMDEDQYADSLPLVIMWLILLATSTLAFFTVGLIGRRMIRQSPDVADTDDDTVGDPETSDGLRIGSARPFLQSIAVATIVLVLGIGTPFLVGPKTWLCFAPLVVLALGAMVWLGPSWAGVSSAHLDSSGIRLLELGVRIPWTSVSRLETSGRGVRLVLDGPTSATGEIWEIWTRRAIRRLESEGGVEVVTNQPDKLIQFAERHRSGNQR